MKMFLHPDLTLEVPPNHYDRQIELGIGHQLVDGPGVLSAEKFTDASIASLLTRGICGYGAWKVALGPMGP